MTQKIFIIPDTQCKPGVKLNHLEAAGNYMKYILFGLTVLLLTACSFEESTISAEDITRVSSVCANNSGVESYTTAGITIRKVQCKNGAVFNQSSLKMK